MTRRPSNLLVVGTVATLIGAAGAASSMLGMPDDGARAPRIGLDLEDDRIVAPSERLRALRSQVVASQRPGGIAAFRVGAPRRAAPAGAWVDVFSTRRTAAEPTMAIGDDGTLYFTGIEVTGDADAVALHQRSRDGGRTWELLDTVVEGVEGDTQTQDPFVTNDPATGRVFFNDYVPPCAPISFTDDGGESFKATSNCLHADHQSLVFGPPAKSGPQPKGGAKSVGYYCAISGGLAFAAAYAGCSRSIDGGMTWTPTEGIPYQEPGPRRTGQFGVEGNCSAATGHTAVGPDGTLYLPRGWCGQPTLAASRDGGATWERVQVADNGMAVGYVNQTDQVLSEHEASVAVDAAGNVYYGWTALDHLPYLAVSRDGGRTFGPPIPLAPPGVKEGWTPFLEAGDAGRLAVVLIASTNTPGGPYCARTTVASCVTADGSAPRPRSAYDASTWNGYLMATTDATAARPTFTTGMLNPPGDPLIRGVCVPHACAAMREFIDVDIARDGTPWAAFVDACPPASAKPADCLPSLHAIGTVARLGGAPPLRGPLPPREQAIAPGGVGLPASRGCVSRRRFTLRLPARARGARVSVDGRRVAVTRRRGRLSAVVDLRGRPAGDYAVRVQAVTRGGRRVAATRRYRTCAGRG